MGCEDDTVPKIVHAYKIASYNIAWENAANSHVLFLVHVYTCKCILCGGVWKL